MYISGEDIVTAVRESGKKKTEYETNLHLIICSMALVPQSMSLSGDGVFTEVIMLK